MVKAYSFLTILVFLLGTVGAGFALYAVFSSKRLCITIDGQESCITSHLSTGQKVGYAVWTFIQWLIDLCEYLSLEPRLLHHVFPPFCTHIPNER